MVKIRYDIWIWISIKVIDIFSNQHNLYYYSIMSQWRNMDRRLKLENLNCLISEFFFSKIYFLDQIYWQALVRPFKWHIGKVCIISRKKVTESGKNIKKGLKFVLFHFFDNENGENIFFGPSQLKVSKRWVLMVLKVFQCLLKQKSYKPNKIFLDLLSTNWAFEPLWAESYSNLHSIVLKVGSG